MARSCAFRIGPRRFELVALDGGVKKHRISAYYAGAFEPGADAAERAAAIRDAAKSHRIPKENISLVLDTGRAAFRRMTLPFTDRAKIDQVLKFEVEAKLPQFDIDEVVVDYHVMTENDAGAELLITAVPKEDIADAIAVAEKAGLEPLEVELETSAIVNAALASDICHIDDAQVLVHIGEQSTSVVVMDAGEVKEMRVIHMGALTHDAPAADAGSDDEDGEAQEVDVDPLEVARRTEQAIKRIRRELGRTVSAARTINPIEAIYVCGQELPGLIGESVLDTPVYLLDCFDEGAGQPADGYGQLVAAYGGAYRQLGGGALKPSLRREELRYSGAWERLEFPVAIACLLLATFLGMINILQDREITRAKNGGALTWLQSSNNFAIGNPRANQAARINPPIEEFKDTYDTYSQKTFDSNGGSLPEDAKDPVEELRSMNRILAGKIEKMKVDLGEIQEVPPPQSAFIGMTLVLGIIEDAGSKWRVSFRQVDAETKVARGNKGEHVEVRLYMTFFAEDSITANVQFADFKRKLQEQPWLIEIEERETSTIEGDQGLSIDGLPIRIDVDKYFDAIGA